MSIMPKTDEHAAEREKFHAMCRGNGIDATLWMPTQPWCGYDNRRTMDLWQGWLARSAVMESAPAVPAATVTEQQAYDMGAKGAPPTERERLLFEAWMRGHCWALCATWDGKGYRSEAEQGGALDPRAMATRRLFAAWRDRAALAALPAGVQGQTPGEAK